MMRRGVLIRLTDTLIRDLDALSTARGMTRTGLIVSLLASAVQRELAKLKRESTSGSEKSA